MGERRVGRKKGQEVFGDFGRGEGIAEPGCSRILRVGGVGCKVGGVG